MLVFMKTVLIHLILIWLFVPGTIFAQDQRQEPLTALPGLNTARIRLGEGAPYCYAGYGTQRLSLRIGGETVHSDKLSNPYLPGFDPTSTTFLRFGCKTDLFFVDFSTVDDSMRLSSDVTHKGSLYNSVRYQYRVLAAGHSLSLIPHRLYLDIGAGYGSFDYTMGLYGNSSVSDYESDTISSDGLLLRLSARVIINHYVMIHWQHEKSLDADYVVNYSGQLGLNFIARF